MSDPKSRVVFARFLKVFIAAGIGLLAFSASLLSQNEMNFEGSYEDAKRIEQPAEQTSQFVFTRLVYNSIIPGYYKNWYTDYPKAGKFLIPGLQRLTNLDIAERERVIALNDPLLFKYPLIYTSEPEQMVVNAEDAAIMREYLTRGGFWLMDDNWGTFDMLRIENNLKKILPDRKIEDIPLSHPLFHSFYDIDRLIQTPSTAYVVYRDLFGVPQENAAKPGCRGLPTLAAIDQGCGMTWEQDGFRPECKGVFDEHGRLMVVINHNTDLGDAYENADIPGYPLPFTTYGYKIALNTIVYALTH